MLLEEDIVNAMKWHKQYSSIRGDGLLRCLLLASFKKDKKADPYVIEQTRALVTEKDLHSPSLVSALITAHPVKESISLARTSSLLANP